MINKKNLFPVLLVFLAMPLFANALTITEMVNNIKSVVWTVLSGVAIVLFVFAGVKFLTAEGNPSKVDEAKKAALWGLAGVGVMILAYSAFDIVTKIIT